MIQCALNGGYSRADHPAVPVTLGQLVADARACRDAGAGSVHLHPRDDDGRQTLTAEHHDAVIAALRAALPGFELSCSTQEDIPTGAAPDRIAAIRAWGEPPDVVSLNLEESGAVELGGALLARGIGIEAGIFTLKDADALLTAPWAGDVTRVLVEVIHETEPAAAVALAEAIDERTARLGRPRLWHGDGHASWAVVDRALALGRDARVGLEDALVDRDGNQAAGNAGQVAAIFRAGPAEG